MRGTELMERRNLEVWIASINEKLDKIESIPRNEPRQPSRDRKRTIHRVPASLREKLPSHSWEPRHLQLGPYHASHESPLKGRVFLRFLKKNNKPLEVYVEALRGAVQDLRDAYDGLDLEPWLRDDIAFLMLMIQDGCVLVETLRQLKECGLSIDYNWDHPLWDVDGISRHDLVEYYKHDLLLLENQLPLELHLRLIAIQDDKNFDEAFHEWTLRIFFPYTRLRNEGRDFRKCLHVLDLYRHSFVRKIRINRLPQKIMRAYDDVNMPSATELKDAGIRITISRNDDISIQHGIVTLPQIVFDGATKSRFINIIAFEQLQEDVNEANEVTSYIYFMSGLVKDANDVRILRSRGIIRTSLRNDDIAEMFNSLTKDIILRDTRTSFTPMHRLLTPLLIETFDKKNREWKKDLWQNYLRSPWAIVSLVAAFVLFALTTIQTVYTILSYYNSK